jgi:hypothetical protein
LLQSSGDGALGLDASEVHKWQQQQQKQQLAAAAVATVGVTRCGGAGAIKPLSLRWICLALLNHLPHTWPLFSPRAFPCCRVAAIAAPNTSAPATAKLPADDMLSPFSMNSGDQEDHEGEPIALPQGRI